MYLSKITKQLSIYYITSLSRISYSFEWKEVWSILKANDFQFAWVNQVVRTIFLKMDIAELRIWLSKMWSFEYLLLEKYKQIQKHKRTDWAIMCIMLEWRKGGIVWNTTCYSNFLALSKNNNIQWLNTTSKQCKHEI